MAKYSLYQCFSKGAEIAPKGAILMGKEAKKTKGAKQDEGDENAQPLINH